MPKMPLLQSLLSLSFVVVVGAVSSSWRCGSSSAGSRSSNSGSARKDENKLEW